MKTLAYVVLTISAGTALLAGCGGSQPSISAPGTVLPAQARANANHIRSASSSYQVLHSFVGGPSDGTYPMAALIEVKGALYGTTQVGGDGSGSQCNDETPTGCGTIFSISAMGTEQPLYSFGGAPDGDGPQANLIEVNGKLYGTTKYGGANYQGAVFSVGTTGEEQVLYSFQYNGADGKLPQAGLVDVKGVLYGTTEIGGRDNDGTVFSVSSAGTESILHSFGGYPSDGDRPVASLAYVNGKLYGTTEDGGKYGAGTVFSITPAGKERVLYSFKGGADGSGPEAGLLDVGGTLYGTTAGGGKKKYGTVFGVTTVGSERVLYTFRGCPDGRAPEANLINVKGTFYGSTVVGGKCTKISGGSGGGTVFSVNSEGVEHVLHSFVGYPSDGSYPGASLIDVKGALYGTTEFGGADGIGTIFMLAP